MSAALDDLDDRLCPGFCQSCERAAPPRRTFCDECAAWMDAGNAIRRAATALRAVPAPPLPERGERWKQAENSFLEQGTPPKPPPKPQKLK